MKNLTRPNYFIIKSFREERKKNTKKRKEKKRNKNKKKNKKESKREMLLLCWLVGNKIKTKE